ncbi:MAG: signal recognition particle protein [Deltaproteobacteria bacterium]|nr:signal recognition particle protein [Deltaproteobacteria bacterium]
MFESLTKGFRQARNRLAGLTELSESNVEPALREVRLSLLEADVELGVVKTFLARVKEKAIGETVRVKAKVDGVTHKVTAEDQFIKICHDELIEMMAVPEQPLVWADSGPTGVMMVGLQGSGKTTTAAKLARLLSKQGKKPLLVAADMQRPAAVDQLQVLGKQIQIPVFNLPDKSPVEICVAAVAEARRKNLDVIVYDTAGRLAIDEVLMDELGTIKSSVHPGNILLVVDAMIGQDAVRTAKTFHEKLTISGVVLTKLDGDARGGAAVSIKEVTGAPILFSGVGEALDRFEEFRADGMASRILGFGDVVGLMKDFEEVIDKEEASEAAMKMLQGQFTFDDFLEQVRSIQKMGPLKDLVDKMPIFPGGIPEGVNIDDKELVRIQAMIQSMTREERNDAYMLVREPSRVKRVSKGSGQPEVGVQELVQKFLFMRQMMSSMSGNMGLLGKIPGVKQIAMAKKMKKAMAAGGGFPGMGMPGMGMPGMGMPGMGMPGMDPFGMGFPGMGGPAAPSPTKMKQLSKAEKNAKKASRKRERDARKKGRK